MAKNITAVGRFVCFMVGVMGLALPAISQASGIDLSKPVQLRDGMGGAVFSITIRGAVQGSSFIKWRTVETDGSIGREKHSGEVSVTPHGIFGNEEFSQTSRHVWGRLAGLELPPGTYEFYGFQTTSSDGKIFFSAKEDYSRRFTIVPGKIRYIGNLDIYEKPPVLGGAGFFQLAFTGRAVGSVEIFPSLLDASELDLPMLFAKENGLAAAEVEKNVAVSEADQHMLDMVSALRTRFEQGDQAAARQLLFGMLDGWTMSDTGETFKVLPNKVLQQQVGEQMAEYGVPGGAYAVGLLKLPESAEKSKAPAPEAEADGKQALDYFLADAEHYFPRAMAQVVRIYRNGIPGVAENRDLSDLWQKRLEATVSLSGKSVPYLNEMTKLEFEKFMAAPIPRYFALSVNGAFGLSKGDGASGGAAIAACEKRNGGAEEHCRLYAENRQSDWDSCPVDYLGPKATVFPPETGLGDLSDASKLPVKLNYSAKSIYYKFIATRMPRALAIADSGEVSMASGDCHAAYKALQTCRKKSGKACQLLALDDQIVLGSTKPELVEEEQRLATLVEEAVQDNAKLASQTVTSSLPIKN